MSHIPLGGAATVGDIEMEQELSRPYVYLARLSGYEHEIGFTIVSIKDPAHAKRIYDWRIENRELMGDQPNRGLRGVTFKLKNRYYYVSRSRFGQGSPDADLGAIVFDVTGLPDTDQVKEVAPDPEPGSPGGFHDELRLQAFQRRALLFTTIRRPMRQHLRHRQVVAAGDAERRARSRRSRSRSSPDAYRSAATTTSTSPTTRRPTRTSSTAPGSGGYYVYDITDLKNPSC